MNISIRRLHIYLTALLFFVFNTKMNSQENPKLDTLILNNGLKIYLLQYGKDPVLNVRLIINGGKKNETKCQVGYSKIIEELISESLNKEQGSVLTKENQSTCEIINGQTILNGNCSINSLNRQIELFCNSVCRVSFTKEKTDRIVSAISDNNAPERMGSLQLAYVFRDFLLFGSKNPLGRKYCQYQIQKVLPEELRQFYNENYTPGRSSLLICGNFNINIVKKIIAKHFIKWRSFHKEENTTKNIDLKLSNISRKDIAFINKSSSENYTLLWAKTAPLPKSPDYMAFLVAFKLFDHFIVEKIKYEKLKFDSLKFKPIFYTNGFMEVSCIANQNNMIMSINQFDTMLQTFHKLKYSQIDVEESIKELKGNYFKNKKNESVLSFYDPLIFNFWSQKNYLTNLSGVSLMQIQKVVEDYFNPHTYKLIIVGKEHIVSNQINLLQNVTIYRSSDFETCDDACKEILVFKCHCESCYKRGYCNVWRFNPNQKKAIKNAKTKAK